MGQQCRCMSLRRVVISAVFAGSIVSGECLAQLLPGDFNGDGVVSGLDGLIWQRGGSLTPLSLGDLADLQANFGAGGDESPGPPIPHDPCTGCEGIIFQMVINPNTDTFKLAVGNFGAGANGLAGWSLSIGNANVGSLVYLVSSPGIPAALLLESAPFASGTGTSLMWLQDVTSPYVDTTFGIGRFFEFASGAYSNGLPAFSQPAGANVFDGFPPISGIIGGFRTIVLPLDGDYNGDENVDAADYSRWRDGLGTTYVPADYEVWRSHFGQSLNGDAMADTRPPLKSVAEPSTLALVGFLVLLLCRRSHRITWFSFLTSPCKMWTCAA